MSFNQYRRQAPRQFFNLPTTEVVSVRYSAKRPMKDSNDKIALRQENNGIVIKSTSRLQAYVLLSHRVVETLIHKTGKGEKKKNASRKGMKSPPCPSDLLHLTNNSFAVDKIGRAGQLISPLSWNHESNLSILNH